MTTARVDAHAHVFRPAAVNPRRVDELAPADRDAPAEELLSLMAASGVENAVLVPLGTEDDAVADAMRAHPGRFVSVAVASEEVQGRAGHDPVGSLLRRLERMPFAALRTSWLGEPGRMAESPMLQTLRFCAENNILIWSYLPPEQFAMLGEALRLVPELQVVLNHLGLAPRDMWVDEYVRPRFTDVYPREHGEAVCALAANERCFLMFSGQYAISAEPCPYPDLRDLGRMLVDAYGPERTLWGSDYPWIRAVPGYPALLDLVDDTLSLSPAERDSVLGDTAHRLFSFAAPTSPIPPQPETSM